MEKAIVLITLEASSEFKALKALQKIKRVTEAHFLYGPYDAYAMIEAETTQQIQETILNNIREIEGIRSTLTCFIAD